MELIRIEFTGPEYAALTRNFRRSAPEDPGVIRSITDRVGSNLVSAWGYNLHADSLLPCLSIRRY